MAPGSDFPSCSKRSREAHSVKEGQVRGNKEEFEAGQEEDYRAPEGLSILAQASFSETVRLKMGLDDVESRSVQ